MASGVLLCGVVASIGDTPVVIGRITGLTGFGVERQAVPNIHNDVTNGWGEVLLSCIKTLKPFRISIVHDTNGSEWKTWIAQSLQDFAIAWPVEQSFSTGGLTEFQAGVTDYTAGSPDIQGRVNAEMTITPSGEPTQTSGTAI